MLTLLVLALGGYLLGSIPTAVIVGRLVAGIDIREQGSGNAGASNVLRVVGLLPALGVLAVDIGKGFAAATIGSLLRLDPLPVAEVWAPLTASALAVLGHLFPVFAQFRGGKGVATAGGVLLALDPLLLAIAILVFGVFVGATRRVSAGSIAAAFSLPVGLLLIGALRDGPPAGAWLGFNLWLALTIVHAHRTNLERLFRGTEPRLRG